VVQEPCPLWLGLDRLRRALDIAVGRLGPAARHAATMTGELSDMFESREQGVGAIANILAERLGAPQIYAGRRGFVETGAALAHVGEIASANWHASATLLARGLSDALFVDMGSTTTDIVPVAGAEMRASGYTDATRLAAGELVYTGLVRSFVMALAARAPVGGAWTPLACEYFASTADVYRILQELPDGADQMPTADGRAKTVTGSIARLARMVGRDATDLDVGDWRDLAGWFAEAQLRQIEDAARLVLSRARPDAAAPVIGAGIGRPVIERLAARLRRPYRDFADLIGGAASGDRISDCATAVAVALLCNQEPAW
jgi:(4-(4-[2-(gamma-L-glutamylamino)ethyl]phenoxymethyl)furan-2-yl)methanamine synthase